LNIAKYFLAICALVILASCSKYSAPQHETRHHVTQAPEQNGHMTVYQQAQPDNSWLYWYILFSNGHSYYYSSPTYVTDYTSLPMTRAASNDVKDLPPAAQAAVQNDPKVAEAELPPAEEPATVEAAITDDRIAELQAEEAAEIAAEQHADEAAAEAQPSSPTEDTSSTGSHESSDSGSSSSDSGSSSSDSGSSGGDSGGSSGD